MPEYPASDKAVLRTNRVRAVDIVVAGGGVVVRHVGQRGGVQAGIAAVGQVEPAADALAGAAGRAAGGGVVGERAAVDLQARSAVVVDAAAEAVAAVDARAGGTADALVAAERTARDG